jgi:gamma-glutamylcyclotransferase
MKGTSTGLTWRVQPLSKPLEKETRHYFAYGSNMSLEQIKGRCPSCEVKGVAVLNGKKVVCNKLSKNKIDHFAGLVDSPTDQVMGVLYLLSSEDISRLDKKEKGYHRSTGEFLVEEIGTGRPIDCFTYLVTNPVTPQRPPPEYLDRILKGCRDHKLPQEYMEKIKAWFDVSGKNSFPATEQEIKQWIGKRE